MFAITIAGLTLLAGLPAGPAAAQPPFDRLVVFGDSLSDTGNAGRFSDGPVWVEHLARALGLPLRPRAAGGTNHAVGGARMSGANGLDRQVEAFLDERRRPGRALVVLYGGGNDVIAGAARQASPAEVEAAGRLVGRLVERLAAAGATDILLPNLPDVGMTPAVAAYGPAAAAEARRLSRLFNEAAEAALGAAGRTVRLHRLDVWSLAERVRRDPASAGFRTVTEPCGGRGSCEGYLFHDGVHPTTAAHERLARAALEVLWGKPAGR
nr:SGNH/GDSL hydrolase family protein [Chthonobacter rhizosphaerae]